MTGNRPRYGSTASAMPARLVAATLRFPNASVATIRFDGVSDAGKAGCGHTGIWKSLPQGRINPVDFLKIVRPGVVIAHLYIDRQIGAGNLDHAAVLVQMVQNDEGMGGAVVPEKGGRYVRRCARRVHADIQQFHSLFR